MGLNWVLNALGPSGHMESGYLSMVQNPGHRAQLSLFLSQHGYGDHMNGITLFYTADRRERHLFSCHMTVKIMSSHGDPALIPGQFMWYSVCKSATGRRFSPGTSVFLCQQQLILVFSFIILPPTRYKLTN